MPQRTPEQEAARRKKQAATAAQTKCRCGNCAAWGDTMCGACRRDFDEQERKEDEVERTRRELDDALHIATGGHAHSKSVTEAIENYIDAKIRNSIS